MVTSKAVDTTLLFIEDDTDSRAYWINALRACSPNYSILEASTGQSGLDLAQRHKVHCVVLDMVLPDLSGFEVLFELVPNRDRPQTAVVVLTRLHNPFLHAMTEHNGALASLVKSRTSADDLYYAIQKAMAFVALMH